MLRWEKGTRYYQAWIETDLLGDTVVMRTNGRIGSRLGRTASIYCNNRDAAITELAKITKTRLKRGYRLRPFRSLD